MASKRGAHTPAAACARVVATLLERLSPLVEGLEATSLGGRYLQLARKHHQLYTFPAGGVACVVGTLAAACFAAPPSTGYKAGLALFLVAVSCASNCITLVSELMLFNDRKQILGGDGKVKREALYACWARYASVLAIGEPPVQLFRFFVLTGFLAKYPPWAANLTTAVVGTLAAGLLFPYMLRGSKKFEEPLRQYFLRKLKRET